MCSQQRTIPTSYKLEGVVREGDYSQGTSQMVEIWKGRYKDEVVALKVSFSSECCEASPSPIWTPATSGSMPLNDRSPSTPAGLGGCRQPESLDLYTLFRTTAFARKVAAHLFGPDEATHLCAQPNLASIAGVRTLLGQMARPSLSTSVRSH